MYETEATSAGPLCRQIEADRAEKEGENEHMIEGGTGPRLPALQQGRRCVFIC